MKIASRFLVAALSMAFLGGLFVPTAVFAVDPGTQFMPIHGYRIGPYAASGTPYSAGIRGFYNMINERDGGVDGVKMSFEECEFEYNTTRGVECYERMKDSGDKGATVFNPLSTGVTYAIIDRATKAKIPVVSMGYGRADASDGRVFPYVFPIITNYWSQSTAKIKFIGFQEGGIDKLKGKTIVNLHHGSGYGRETIPILELQAKKYGFKLINLEVPHPGVDQKSQWLQIRRIKPDWVILRGWGVMTPTALKTASQMRFPANKIVGVWWSGSEDDVIPAGDAAIGYISTTFHGRGTDYSVTKDILKYTYGKGLGDYKGDDEKKVGYVLWSRGVINGIVMTEAIRTAHKKFGNRVLSGEEMRWGLENLDINSKRVAELGATDFMMPLKLSCFDHEGGGAIKFQQWDGKKWNLITDWIQSDQSMVRPLIEASAAKYAAENKITPRDCKN
ncbi:MAG: ABC transporter substrate-binding protein [SAR324 cluster bacterium]|nr:ABC transporter substrate-binding protein [SAR324 cluster bacterium]